jgi:hypothetical protein
MHLLQSLHLLFATASIQRCRNRGFPAVVAAGWVAVLAFSSAGSPTLQAAEGEVGLRWLEEDQTGSTRMGTACGVPWPMGACPREATFTLTDQDKARVPVQTWPLAYWPDGSLKWTGLAVGPRTGASSRFTLTRGAPTLPETPLTVQRDGDGYLVDTGVIECRLAGSGSSLISSIAREGRTLFTGGRLVCLNQNQPSEPSNEPTLVASFESRIEAVTVEQNGPVRAVVRVEGKHAGPGGRAFLPFVVRLYFYAGSANVRMMHTFIFDGDEYEDFVRGLGVRFDVPMRDELYDRHVRFASADGGLWAEAVRPVTGQRRDPGEQVRKLQVEGKALPPTAEWDQRVATRLKLIPSWADFTLSQLTSDGYTIRKRTKPGHGWIGTAGGTRAAGAAYVGGVTGGVAFGLRDFWQSFPSQIDIRNAAAEQAEATLWLWAPDAKAMDLRFYHDGMGMETHEQELEGLNITYEDYEEGFGTPYGVARTSELNFWVVPATPSGQDLLDFAADAMTPPLLTCAPEQPLVADVFGGLWSLPDRSTPSKARIEDRLEEAFTHYVAQREERRWYGFWNYGDVMHTYDPDRHMWRYDVGGYAWDNSELSPDLWLWYGFLRSGRADIFRFAEAMTRHTGEVDVYHLGQWKMLGSRHNVQHWGCSCKQLRISSAIYRRFYYYLTADERVGDLMREVVNAEQTFLVLDPYRKIREGTYEPKPDALDVGTGTDFSALAAAWLTEWERTEDEQVKQKLFNAMTTIGEMEYGWFTGGPRFDAATGKFHSWNPEASAAGMSHLSAVFGLPEVCAELIQLLDVPGFKEAWLQYCTWYNADREARKQALGIDFRTGILTTGHSRLTAYAAHMLDDPALAERAWDEFFSERRRKPERFKGIVRRYEGVDSLNPVTERTFMDTNGTALFGIAAIQNLGLIGESLAEDDPRTR